MSGCRRVSFISICWGSLEVAEHVIVIRGLIQTIGVSSYITWKLSYMYNSITRKKTRQGLSLAESSDGCSKVTSLFP